MKIISTRRCNLRALNKKDFEILITLYTNEEVRKYLGGVRSPENAWDSLYKHKYNFTVRLNKTKSIIGIIMIAPHHDSEDMEISYMFLPQFWGNGYATETVKAVLDFCKNELKLNRVVSETQTANEYSCRLLEKIGYTAESKVERFGADQTIYVYNFN